MIERLTWAIHNIVAHPIMGILEIAGKREAAQFIHDITVPSDPTRPRRAPPGDIDYESLDPGIRDVVRKIRMAGFVTSDSGDGTSKFDANGVSNMEGAIPIPHVFVISDLEHMIEDSKTLKGLFPDWDVEASYRVGEEDIVPIMVFNSSGIAHDFFD